jgi:hypothetical protein
MMDLQIPTMMDLRGAIPTDDQASKVPPPAP